MDHVLVVDDDPAICELIGEALRERELTVVCQANDKEAYARLAAAPPIAALVVDINLGTGTTGYDVARYARRMNPRIGVVYISGAVGTASFNAFGVPGSAFVLKPFTGQELADAVVGQIARA